MLTVIAALLFSFFAYARVTGGQDILAGLGAEISTEEYIIETDSPFRLKIKFDDKYEILNMHNTKGWRFIADNGNVRWDEEKVREYFAGLKEKYDTPMGEVEFTNHKGERMVMQSTSCGWHLNIDFSVSRLESAVADGAEEMDPAFNSGCVYCKDNGVGRTYVEVDIQEQRVYLFEDGENTFTTDCVTGTAGYTDTKTGVFQVQGKSSPATLRDVDQNGNKYEQPVEYWIAFNGSQGLHDAVWRGDFGKDYYKTRGSHGCVNLPLASAERIYGAVSMYTPVIVY